MVTSVRRGKRPCVSMGQTVVGGLFTTKPKVDTFFDQTPSRVPLLGLMVIGQVKEKYVIVTSKEKSDELQSLSGMVKWYDSGKGFGFVLVEGFEAEFLLHRNVLRNFLRDSIAEGSRIEFLPEFTPNGSRIAAINSITAPDLPDHVSFSMGGVVSPQRFPARVKWFDHNKGYGFVNNYGDREDVFVGSDALTRSGLSSLRAGEAVCIRVENEAGRRRVFQIYDWPQSD